MRRDRQERLRMSMEVAGNPTVLDAASLTEALAAVADSWPGSEVIEPCLFERLDSGEIIPTLDELLQKRGVLRDSSTRYLDLFVEIIREKAIKHGVALLDVMDIDELRAIINETLTALTPRQKIEAQQEPTVSLAKAERALSIVTSEVNDADLAERDVAQGAARGIEEARSFLRKEAGIPS